MNVTPYKDLLLEKITTWYEALVQMLPNFVLSILIVFLAYFIAKITHSNAKKLLWKFSKNKAANNLVAKIFSIIVITIGILTALNILKLEKSLTSLLAGAGVIGLALGFAFQEIASNFIAGVLIAFQKPYQVGDIVELESFSGRVQKINLRTTIITTFQGLEVIVPNKDMFTKAFINFTSTPKRRIDLNVGVSYGDDLDHVVKVSEKALEKVEYRDQEKPVEVFFYEFGDSSINFKARIWVDYSRHKNFVIARHQAILNLKRDFDKEGISIPFPIRTLDFGIKGGEKLNQMLEESN